MSGDGYVQVAADGAGKKVATQEFTRADGSIVEAQQVVATDPLTGRPLDAPAWAELLAVNRLILTELRVLTALLADETRAPDRQVEDLRDHFEEQLQ